MESKIIIRQFTMINANKEIQNINEEINSLNKKGWKTKASNLITNNNIKFTIYILMELEQ